jgi:hypothetical protein
MEVCARGLLALTFDPTSIIWIAANSAMHARFGIWPEFGPLNNQFGGLCLSLSIEAAPVIAESLSCYRCQGTSTRGMLVEPRDQHQMRWVSGTARTGWGRFVGEGSGDRERYRVVTYRCTRCGALESFAIEPE